MRDLFWLARNVAVVVALFSVAMGAYDAVDWPVAWTAAMMAALFAKVCDNAYRRLSRGHAGSMLVFADAVRQRRQARPEPPKARNDRAA